MKKANILIMLIILVLIFKIFFIQVRFVSPDEGNHLYAAGLVLEGMMPYVDFNARQPLYLFTLSLLTAISGHSLFLVRIFPVLCNLGTAVFIFLIGKRLYSEKAGLIASAAFLLAPSSILWSSVVLTEPYSVMLLVVSMYFFIKDDRKMMLVSGMFLGLAFLVRQSAVYFLPVVIVWLFLQKKQDKVMKTAIFVSGLILVIGIFLVLFSARYGASGLWNSSLNPLEKLTSKSIQAGIDQSFARASHEFLWAVYFNSFFIFAALMFFLHALKDRKSIKKDSLLLLWLLFLTLFYALYFLKRGFFSHYSYEFLPVFSIMLGVFISGRWSLFRLDPWIPKAFAVVLFAVSFIFFSPSFGSVWSPQTVDQVSSRLAPGDTVLSGTLIWQYQSGSRAFMDITNTLGLRGAVPDSLKKEIMENFDSSPPDYIILDGYTEQDFISNIPSINRTIADEFTLEYRDNGSKYVVSLYRRNV